ncbi:MFS family muropeptide transporter [Wenzhouxiangella marina]|uniref:MFS family muropeptide transporter n=2 Tax=Wenzhouxiangella marina TaxID=1579979 RepID=A0A0K0XSC6_9GAMM|nr:MFS family muropeptide transporter [Wenzhouxiangella marina]
MLLAWKDRRLGTIFVLGMASGFPWVLIGSAMSAWLQELGVSRTAIGFIGGVAVAYALNFLWAPLLDRFRPWLFGRLGLRRGWILLTQCLLALLTFSVSLIHPAEQLQLIGAVLLGIAIASATQDIAIDAYRVELIPREDQARISYGAAMATSGWWTGYGLLGALPFWLVDDLDGGWTTVYQGLSLVWLGFIAFILLLAPMPQARIERADDAGEPLVQRLFHVVVLPLKDFFVRNGLALALSLLAFVLLFKVGEAFLGRMSIVFYREVGFTNEEIGTYSKLLNWWVTVVFAILGSLVNARFGILRGLVVGGIAMASTNLMFAWMAAVGPETWLFALTVIVDGFTAALGTVAFMAFITLLTSHSFSATQYALLASIGNLGRTTLSSSSGWVVDKLGGNWELFFVLTAMAVLPSLLLLVWLAPRLRARYPDAFGIRRPQSPPS